MVIRFVKFGTDFDDSLNGLLVKFEIGDDVEYVFDVLLMFVLLVMVFCVLFVVVFVCVFANDVVVVCVSSFSRFRSFLVFFFIVIDSVFCVLFFLKYFIKLFMLFKCMSDMCDC